MLIKYLLNVRMSAWTLQVKQKDSEAVLRGL